MKKNIFAFLFSLPLLAGPYTQGIDFYLDSNISDGKFTVQLTDYSSLSTKGSIENIEKLKLAPEINRGKFERLEFTMPKDSSSPEVHNVHLLFEVKKAGEILGSCKFEFTVEVAWRGALSWDREFSLRKNPTTTPNGQVSCRMFQGEDTYARGRKVLLNKIGFVINALR